MVSGTKQKNQITASVINQTRTQW